MSSATIAFNENADNIYRLRVERFSGGGEAEYTSTASAPMLLAALADVPQIEAGTRINQRRHLVKNGDLSFFEEQFIYVDSTFFDVFSFSMLQGDAEEALRAPNSLILTQTTAERYFGSTDPVGKRLDVDGTDMTVSRCG